MRIRFNENVRPSVKTPMQDRYDYSLHGRRVFPIVKHYSEKTGKVTSQRRGMAAVKYANSDHSTATHPIKQSAHHIDLKKSKHKALKNKM